MISARKNSNLIRYPATITKILPGNALIAEVMINNEKREVRVMIGKSSLLTKSNKVWKIYPGDLILIAFDSYDDDKAILVSVIKTRIQA